MTGEHRFGVLDFVLFLVILAMAAGVRAGYLIDCAHNGRDDGPVQVQESAQGTAQASARQGDALYPWFISLLHQVSRDPGEVSQLARWFQAGFGSLTAACYFLFACRAFASRWAGLLAGLAGALHPFWIVSTAELNDGALAAFLLALCILFGSQDNQSGSFLRSWLFGLSLAALALVRGALLPFAWVALLWYLLRCRAMQRGWLFAVLAFLGFVTGLTPRAIQNYRNSLEILPVESTWAFMWQGNNPQATGGAWRPNSSEGFDPTSQNLAHAVASEIRSNPSETIRRRLWAGLSFLFGEEWFSTKKLWRDADMAQAGKDVPQWFRLSYAGLMYGWLLLMFLLAFLGWRWSYDRRQAAMLLSLALIWIPAPYVLGHAESLQGPRLPLDGVLICYAAFALTCMLPRVRKNPTENTLLPPGAKG